LSNCSVSELITAPVPHLTGRAGVKELISAKIFQENSDVISIHVDIAVKVTVTGVSIGAGVEKCTSSEIIQE
jgi:hypothetical protein